MPACKQQDYYDIALIAQRAIESTSKVQRSMQTRELSKRERPAIDLTKLNTNAIQVTHEHILVFSSAMIGIPVLGETSHLEFLDLPEHLLYDVLQRVDRTSLCSFAQCSRQTFSLAAQRCFWENGWHCDVQQGRCYA